MAELTPHDPEAVHERSERDEELAFTLGWIEDALKNRYVDGTTQELTEALAAFDNPVLREVPDLDTEALAGIKAQIKAACDERTREGFAELQKRFEQVEGEIRVTTVNVGSNGKQNGLHIATLKGIHLGENNLIYPEVHGGGVITEDVFEVSYKERTVK